MHVRCPHCQSAHDVLVDEDLLTQMDCPTCGTGFSLVDEPAATVVQGPEGSSSSTVEYGAEPQNPTIGHFRLLRKLGEGSFGTVWQARDEELDRLVAVKFPRKDELTPAESAKFVREARAAAQVKHANIVSVHEVGRAKDTIYIVTDFVDGVPLDEWLTAKPIAPADAATICIRICDALHHAHEAGVIHRDLKPGNILLDSNREPHILDFGLAKRESGEIVKTMEGRILGTPAYMSPEQATGQGYQADRRADVYAVGVMLFQMLTGELPFRGSVRMLIHQVIHDEPPSPRTLHGQVPRDLETITLKCIAKEPSRRYQTAKDLGEDLSRYVNGEPVKARPVGAAERLLRWCRRNQRVAFLAGTAIVLLVAVACGSTVSAVWIANEQKRTELARAEAQEHFEQARNAVNEMLTEVGQEWLSNIPQMEDVRRRLLHKALAFYQEFLKSRPTDPALRHETARAYLRIGDISAMLMRNRHAGASYEKAIAMLQMLADEFPGEPDYQRELARAYNQFGEFQRTRSELPQRARASYQTAIELQQGLADRFPDDAVSRQELARSRYNLAILLRDSGENPAAQEHFDQAATLLKALVAREPAAPAYRQELARTYDNLGILRKNTGQIEAAETSYRQAIDLFTALADLPGAKPEFRRELASSYVNLGNVLRLDRNRSRDAQRPYERAIALFEDLAKSFPSVPEYRKELANSYNNLAALHGRFQDLEKANAFFRNAQDILQSLVEQFGTVPEYQHLLGGTLGNRGLLLRLQGKPDEAELLLRAATRHGQKALDTNPSHPSYNNYQGKNCDNLCRVLIGQRKYDEAVEAAVSLGELQTDRWHEPCKGADLLASCLHAVNADREISDFERVRLTERTAKVAAKLLHNAVERGLCRTDQLGDYRQLDLFKGRAEFDAFFKDLDQGAAAAQPFPSTEP